MNKSNLAAFAVGSMIGGVYVTTSLHFPYTRSKLYSTVEKYWDLPTANKVRLMTDAPAVIAARLLGSDIERLSGRIMSGKNFKKICTEPTYKYIREVGYGYPVPDYIVPTTDYDIFFLNPDKRYTGVRFSTRKSNTENAKCYIYLAEPTDDALVYIVGKKEGGWMKFRTDALSIIRKI